MDVPSTAEADGAEDKNAARSALIGDRQIVISSPSADRQPPAVVRAGVHPIKKFMGYVGRCLSNSAGPALLPRPLAGPADHMSCLPLLARFSRIRGGGRLMITAKTLVVSSSGHVLPDLATLRSAFLT